jgi:type IV pilus assembly protein PilY1
MTTRTLPALALALALLPASAAASDAACSMLSSSYADAILNPPKGEDTEFFASTGGVPNVMFLLDTSGSMIRLPPDGASAGWGTFEKPLNVAKDMGYGCTNPYANALVFHSPCGETTLDGLPYSGATDFAEAKDAAGQYCSYMVSGNQAPATNKPGFDPDFYPQFFAKDRVYHDTVLSPVNGSDGWSDTSTSPHAAASVANFCAGRDTADKRTSCSTCMATYGYWFDGTYQSWGTAPSCANTAYCAARGYGTCIKDATGLEWNGGNDNTAHCRIPHVWFSGNFLNFYPPKFLVARKVLKDTLAAVRKIRLGLTIFNGSTGEGGVLQEKLNPTCNMLGSPSNFDSNRS